MRNEKMKSITEEIAQFILNDEKFKDYRLDTTWTSGESTEVYPVECGYSDSNNEYYVVVQLDTQNRYWFAKVRSLMKRIKTKFSQCNIEHLVIKYDGSCPNTLEIYIKE